MMIALTNGSEINGVVIHNYFRTLVNLFFKILPMRESGEASLNTYMQSLQCELCGCRDLIEAIDNDPRYMSLISILEYLIQHPGCEFHVVRREVFRAISICNKLQAKYAAEVGP